MNYIDKELSEKLEGLSLSDLHFRRYNKLIQLSIDKKFENYDYYEFHHYLPRSLFPEYINRLDNIIKVPAKLHYILHFLLLKITKSPQMIMAFNQMGRIKNKLNNTGKMYANSRFLFTEIQKKRRHFYNKISKERIFTLIEPDENWLPGVPEENNLGKHGNNAWIFNPNTNEQIRILKNSEIPDGFISGRIDGFKNGLFKMNKTKKWFSLIQKRKVLSLNKERDFCNDPGQKVSVVYKFNDKITISKKYIKLLFGISFNETVFRFNPGEFIIPKPHNNMKLDWKYFCEKNLGKTFMDVGMKIIPISEFIYDNEECI